MPYLELDDPEWPMPQPDRGRARPESVPRRLRVWHLDDGGRVAVVTERGYGASVTNCAELVHAALTARFGRRIRVIEHYPAGEGVRRESFDEITLEPGRPATWRPVPIEEIAAWCGPEVRDDMPALPPDPTVCPPAARRRLPAPTGPGIGDEVTVHGYPPDLVVLEAAGGEPIGPLPHYERHSPGGYSWGYGGSGPAELARCLLIAVYGELARCPECAGTGFLVDDQDGEQEPYDSARHDAEQAAACLGCNDGILLPPAALYQAFKEQLVANWPPDREFRITGAEARAWIAAHQATPR